MSDYEFDMHVKRLMKDPAEVCYSLTPEKVDLLHAALGISGEVGELTDAIKKHVFYNKPLDYPNVVEELGDIEFYLCALRQRLTILRERTLQHNIEKLGKRYPAGYSDAAAAARADKE